VTQSAESGLLCSVVFRLKTDEAVNQMQGFLGVKGIHNSCTTPRKRDAFEFLE